jgi:hypothetical protein
MTITVLPKLLEEFSRLSDSLRLECQGLIPSRAGFSLTTTAARPTQKSAQLRHHCFVFGTKVTGFEAKGSASSAEVRISGALPQLLYIFSRKNNAIPVTGRGGICGCEILVIPRFL